MNYIDAIVTKVEKSGILHIVEFEKNKQYLYMMSLELPKIDLGVHVKLAIKPLNIAIAKRFTGSFSFSNKLFATVKSIETGDLLSSIKLDLMGEELESIVNKKAIDSMHLKLEDQVTLFIKASDISIKEIL